MRESSILPFDGTALYRALDARRTELGLSWSGVADQIWDLSFELNYRRSDHPISPATLTKMAEKPGTSCQHAVFMLRWLGRTPESFLRGANSDDERFAPLRWDRTVGFAGRSSSSMQRWTKSDSARD